MDFAINYSNEAADLLAEGAIQVDRFKVPDWEHLIAAAEPIRPIYVHFPMATGLGRLDRVDWDRVVALRAATHTPYVNVHLTLQGADFPDDTPHDAAIEFLLSELKPIVERFGAEHVIVENVPYYGGAPDMIGLQLARVCVEPTVISAVIAETGCGLLLDVSHARISAAHLGWDAQAYISALPVASLREMHVTGLDYYRGKLTDHFPMRAEDWGIIEWAFAQIHAGAWGMPAIAAFEYGGVGLPAPLTSHREAIAADVPRLYALTHGEPLA